MSGTVELRGQEDVSDALADQDAGGLFRALQRYGYIAGDPGPAPELICAATRLEACDIVKSPAAGVLSYTVELGQTVRDGDILAWLIDPAADDPVDARRAIPARSSGFVLNRRAHKYVVAGLDIAKVVGTEPLAWRSEGQLMTD